jgi:hypothetical protein
MEEAGAEVVASLRAGEGQGPLLVVEGEERRLLEAAQGVEARRKEVAGQRAAACGAVNGHFDAVVAAAERRRGELLASLTSEAERKDLGLAGQQAALEGRAGRLGALRAEVEQRTGEAGGGRGVVALVESANRLREEARAIQARTQQEEEGEARPVEEADVVATLDEKLPAVVGGAGWAGAFGVDPAESALTLKGVETTADGGVAAVMRLGLVDVRRAAARPGAEATLAVEATPQALVQGPPRVERQGGGVYRIVVPLVVAPQGEAFEGGLRVRVRTGGQEVQGSPATVAKALWAYRPRFDAQLHARDFKVQADGRTATLMKSYSGTWYGACLSPALPARGSVYWKISVRDTSVTNFFVGVATEQAQSYTYPFQQRGSHFFQASGTAYSGDHHKAAGSGPVFEVGSESVVVFKFEVGWGRLSVRMQGQQQVFTISGILVGGNEKWYPCVVSAQSIRVEVLDVQPEDCF